MCPWVLLESWKFVAQNLRGGVKQVCMNQIFMRGAKRTRLPNATNSQNFGAKCSCGARYRKSFIPSVSAVQIALQSIRQRRIVS